MRRLKKFFGKLLTNGVSEEAPRVIIKRDNDDRAEHDDLSNCTNCDDTFEYKRIIRKHTQSDHEGCKVMSPLFAPEHRHDSLIVFTKCGLKDALNTRTKSYIKVNENRVMSCDNCGEIFDDKCGLNAPSHRKHVRKKTKCDDCNCPKILPRGLTAHLLMVRCDCLNCGNASIRIRQEEFPLESIHETKLEFSVKTCCGYLDLKNNVWICSCVNCGERKTIK